jgi:hypothetical protein
MLNKLIKKMKEEIIELLEAVWFGVRFVFVLGCFSYLLVITLSIYYVIKVIAVYVRPCPEGCDSCKSYRKTCIKKIRYELFDVKFNEIISIIMYD